MAQFETGLFPSGTCGAPRGCGGTVCAVRNPPGALSFIAIAPSDARVKSCAGYGAGDVYKSFPRSIGQYAI
jgi:hypothetical protein